MEKRKDAAGYQHQCFTMMVLLNVIIVLFLTFTIVLTQYRVAAAQEAQKFIGTLKVMPERPEQRIIMVIFSLFFLCFLNPDSLMIILTNSLTNFFLVNDAFLFLSHLMF